MTARTRCVMGFAAVLVVVVAVASPDSGRTAGSPVGPLPLLGTVDSATTLMGASPGGEPGEAWGYRQLPLAVGDVRVGTRQLAFGPAAGSGVPSSQLAFLRHTDVNGWQVFETPLDELGNPYRGPIPNRLSARVTPGGGGVLVGRDLNREAGKQLVVLHHDPGGSWRALDPPPPEVLLPAEGEQSPEALADENGSGAIAVAAFDDGGTTSLFFGPTGRSAATGIVRFDGPKREWTREPIEIPVGSEKRFHILAVDATGPGNAWALAKADESLGRSVVLLERTSTPKGALWVERPLAGTSFADRDTPSTGIVGAEAIGGAAQPLTVTSDGVWIDLTASINSVERDITLFYAIGSGAVTGSWCDDAGACGAELGVKLSRQGGYRSFAWPGAGFGTRVITNPLDPGGSESSNRGTYLRFDGSFVRMPGGGGSFRPSGAFANIDNGWLEGPIEISTEAPPALLRPWPAAIRAPLTDIAAAPTGESGGLGSGALAVGADGSVARYVPGKGWRREFLLSSSGSVNKATLRGVSWPEPARAHAVGDRGAMWMWNKADELWVPDPGIPIGFEGNLMDIAFDPADPYRGYAVGKGGVLLGYGKGWDQMTLPAGYEGANLTSIAFAGGQAIVAAGGDLLVNDGGAWRVDPSAHALLEGVRAGTPQLFAAAGLPDGGAVAAGRDIVIERDGPTSPWRFSSQPILGSTAVAAGAFRSGSSVRAVVSVVPQLTYPLADDLPELDPNVPPPIPPPFGLPGDGYLLRETANGWEDQQRTAFAASGNDRPLKSDPVLALLLDSAGNGWAVGGWSGDADSFGRGTSARSASATAIRARVRTAAIFRYGAGAASSPAATGSQAVPMPAGPIRIAVAGNAQCDESCADLVPQALGPDRTLLAALRTVATMHGGAGPRALLYTGNRVKTGLGPSDGTRYAELLASQPSLPVYPALGSSDVSSEEGAGVFQAAFAAFPAPLGAGSLPAGISTAGIPGAVPASNARTHYAFDTTGSGGRLRVVVIDNSLGSLAASDLHQNPSEAQLPWLETVLADAKAKGIPVIVMGNRSLNANFTPKLNVASDADQVARALVAGGASAYLFDRPEENRTMRIPAGGTQTIPSFGTGTLGYRSEISGAVGLDTADSLFGDSGVVLLEVDGANRDSATNIAPVGVRLIPVIEDLSLEATDGTLLRRSRPALFRGLGRRPRGGDRWGQASAGSGTPDPSGGDPYTLFPPDQCLVAGCAARINPEYSFVSSDPDIADFVRQDATSTNLRKPFLDESDKVVTDNTSSLLCPFNAGTTTLTVSSGGFAYSEQVTVLDGSVQRPCGTRPLRPDRFKRASAIVPPPAPPPPTNPPPSNPPIDFTPPPLPPPQPVSPPLPNPPLPNPPPLPLDPFVPLTVPPLAVVPAIVPPPPPPIVRPLPPGGAPARTYQVEEKREEEAATEESQAFSRHNPNESGLIVPPQLLALVLIAALAGASVRAGPGARRRTRPTPVPILEKTTDSSSRDSWDSVIKPRDNRTPRSRR